MISAIFSSENCIIYGRFFALRRLRRQSGAKTSLKGIRGPDTPPVSPSAWPAQPAGLNGRGADSPPLSRSPRDLPCGRSRGPYCASAHAAACPPGALLRQRQGRDACAPLSLSARLRRIFPWMDIRAQAPARTSPPGGLEAIIPRQRPKTRQRGRLPMYSSVCRQAVPMDQRGTLAPPAQE